MNAKTYFRFCLFVPLLVPLPFFLFKGDGGLSALFVGSLIFGIPPYILVYLLPLVFLIEKMTERQMVIGTIFFPILFPLVFGLFWVIVPQFISSVTIKLTGTTEWVFIAIVLPASYSMLFLSGNIIRKLIIGEMGLLERRLAAVLCADVKDYSQHMEQDETGTLHRLKTYRDIFDEDILEHRGRIANRAGDSVVAEFGSVIDAIKCACNVQQHFKIMNEKLPPEQYLQYRIGINLGDVMSKGEDIQGEGVNAAAQIEGMTEPGGICISGSVYDRIKNKLTFAYEYLGEQSLNNIEEPVRVYRILLGINEAPVTEPEVELSIPDKPSIVVLPFDNMSSEPEQMYFSDGITEDIITDLSKLSGLFIISRHSAFMYKGKSANVKQVSKDLGVRFVLEGSVRKVGNRLRISAQLIDAVTDNHLWADRYDREVDDIFEIQDEVSRKIVNALEVKLTGLENKRLGHKGTDNLEAHDYLLRGQEQFYLFTSEGIRNGIEMLSRAIEYDLEYAEAYALKSRILVFIYISKTDAHAPKEKTLVPALVLARKAVELDDLLPLAHASLGWVLLWNREIDEAITETKQAIELDPNFADGYMWQSLALSSAGRGKEALESIEKGIRINPHFTVTYLMALGAAYHALGQYEKALLQFERGIERNPNFYPNHLFKTSMLGLLGRIEEAEAAAANLLHLGFNRESAPRDRLNIFNDGHLAELITEGLVRAGL